MAIQSECDYCGESYPADSLIMIEERSMILCSECINS
jgi:hypothetical protein